MALDFLGRPIRNIHLPLPLPRYVLRYWSLHQLPLTLFASGDLIKSGILVSPTRNEEIATMTAEQLRAALRDRDADFEEKNNGAQPEGQDGTGREGHRACFEATKARG